MPITNPIDNSHIERATIRAVIDGDTVEVTMQDANNRRLKTVHRVRMIGADAPELRGAERKLGQQARKFTKQYCKKGRRIWLVRVPGANNDGSGTDAHRRLRRHVWIAHPQNSEVAMRRGQLGAMLLAAGLAKVVSPSFANANREIFQSIEREAIRRRRGIWKTRRAG